MIKQSELSKIVKDVGAAIKSINYRTKAIAMIISTDPNRNGVVDRHLSKRAKQLILQADENAPSMDAGRKETIEP